MKTTTRLAVAIARRRDRGIVIAVPCAALRATRTHEHNLHSHRNAAWCVLVVAAFTDARYDGRDQFASSRRLPVRLLSSLPPSGSDASSKLKIGEIPDSHVRSAASLSA